MVFPEILKNLRKENGLSAKILAQQLNCSTNIIYDWEHGRCEPSFSTLTLLSQKFKVSVGFLLGVEDDFGNVNVVTNGAELTKDEKTLLDCFNKLGVFERDAILIQIKALARKNESETIKK